MKYRHTSQCNPTVRKEAICFRCSGPQLSSDFQRPPNWPQNPSFPLRAVRSAQNHCKNAPPTEATGSCLQAHVSSCLKMGPHCSGLTPLPTFAYVHGPQRTRPHDTSSSPHPTSSSYRSHPVLSTGTGRSSA